MSAPIVNLNKARKAKRRDQETETAAQNRVSFGRTKHERALAQKNEARAQSLLEGAKRAPDSNAGDSAIGDTKP